MSKFVKINSIHDRVRALLAHGVEYSKDRSYEGGELIESQSVWVIHIL